MSGLILFVRTSGTPGQGVAGGGATPGWARAGGGTPGSWRPGTPGPGGAYTLVCMCVHVRVHMCSFSRAYVSVELSSWAFEACTF